MGFTEAPQHGALAARVGVHLEAGVFVEQAVQRVRQLLFVAVLSRDQRLPEHRPRVARRDQVKVVFFVGVVQHRVAVDLVDPGHGANVAGHAFRYLHLVLALQPQQMGHLERLAAVADEQLGIGRDRTLVDAEDAELAAEHVVADLKDMGHDMGIRTTADVDRLCRLTFAAQELRWIALGRVRHQAPEDFEQFRHAGAGACRNEAHRNQMAFAQGLLERIVELLGIQRLALLEIEGHQIFVDLDDLVHDLLVGGGDGRECRACLVIGREETVDDAAAVQRGQVDRQAFGPERRRDAVLQGREIDAGGVDLVDDDHAALAGRGRHHPSGYRLDAGLRIDHHDGGLDCRQCGQCPPQEIGRARCVEQVHPVFRRLQMGDADIDRVADRLFLGIVVGNGVAPFQAAGSVDRAGTAEQRLQQLGLAAPGLAQQGDVADVVYGLRYHLTLLPRDSMIQVSACRRRRTTRWPKKAGTGGVGQWSSGGFRSSTTMLLRWMISASST